MIVFSSLHINSICAAIYSTNKKKGWWKDGEPGIETVATKLCLIHSEISEALEGVRKKLKDDKLPHRQMIEVELADAVIRIFDLAGALHLDLGGALQEKIDYNAVREDHKPEVRAGEFGKKI